MKKQCPVLTLGVALLFAPLSLTLAQPAWKTVADFECRLPATVDALAKDSSGNLYAAVSTSEEPSRMRALIRKSSDQGKTWMVVHEAVSAPHGAVQFASLGVDSAGHVYAAGYVTDEKFETRWVVKKSEAGGQPWSTVDDFALPGGQSTMAQGIATDARGNLYVVGYGDAPPATNQTAQETYWLVRQSTDGGRTWSTIEQFKDGFSARATSVLATPTGLFVAGSSWNGKTDSAEHWLVRKGTADGESGFRWQTADDFQIQGQRHGFVSRAEALGVDGQGNLYAVGRSHGDADGVSATHWVVRRASSTGDWRVVDTFQLHPGDLAVARGIAAGPRGVYVVGQAIDHEGGCHWIVRHSATGEAGSWLGSDDFQMPSVSSPDPTTSELAAETLRGSTWASPLGFSLGSDIVCNAELVFASGSARAASSHALVRKLGAGRPAHLAATQER